MHELGRHLLVEVGGVGAVLLGEREEAAPVELGGAHELEQLIVVVLGLTRVADDEVRAEGGARLGGPDGGDALEELVPVPPPAHAAQQRRRHVLQGEVEVGDPGGADGVDQGLGEVGRVQVEQPHPVHPLGHRAARAAPMAALCRRPGPGP